MRMHSVASAVLLIAALQVAWLEEVVARPGGAHMLRQLRQDGDGVSDDRLPADPKIAGGVDAECGRYPYMVSLRDRNDRHRWGPAPLEMLARETIVHSNYTGDVRDGNDIALIHLPTPSRHIFAGLPQSSEELQGCENLKLAGGISSSTPMPTLPTMGANESAPAINETTPSADESTPDADESVAASPVVAAPAMAPVPSTGDGVDGLEEGGLTPEDQESVNQILWIGAFTGDVGLVEQAIAGGADVDVRLFDFGDTPLTAAALNGHANVTVVLLEAGADPNRPRSFDGITPLFGASQEGHIEVVTALLEGGADANAPIDNDSQLTALVTASQFGRADVVDALLAAGADPNMLVQDFFAPLHFSTLTLGDPSEAIATALLDAGADIDAQGGQGWTPLVLSSFFGNVGVTEILVGRGANVSVVSTAGNVAEELVCLCTELGEQSDIFRCPEGGCEFPETAEVIRELLAGA
eukprot:evm.model.scf_675.2 EVM.evm.TU.scf_675.2   scf_675:57736-67422(-)